MLAMSYLPTVLIISLLGLVVAYILYLNIKKQDSGSEKMQKISANIHLGAMTFLKAEYQRLALFVFVVAFLLLIGFSWKVAFSFILGAFCSALAGFIGMKAATRSNSRTTWAAKESGIAKALLVAFNGKFIFICDFRLFNGS